MKKVRRLIAGDTLLGVRTLGGEERDRNRGRGRRKTVETSHYSHMNQVGTTLNEKGRIRKKSSHPEHISVMKKKLEWGT